MMSRRTACICLGSVLLGTLLPCCYGASSAILIEPKTAQAMVDECSHLTAQLPRCNFSEKPEFSTLLGSRTLSPAYNPSDSALWLASTTRKMLFLTHYPVLTMFHQWHSKAFLFMVLAAPLVYSLGGLATVPILTRFVFGCSASLLTLALYLAGTLVAFSSLLLLGDNNNSSVVLHLIASSLCSSPIFILLGLSGGFDAVRKGHGCAMAVRSMLHHSLVQWIMTIVGISTMASLLSIISMLLLLCISSDTL